MFLTCNLSRTVVRITGKDRFKHLHSFCTADIRAMQPGDIREAMVLDTKGKLKCLVHVLCREESLELNAVPGQAQSLISHLDMYVIREDVRFEDCSDRLQHTFCFSKPATPESGSVRVPELAWNRFLGGQSEPGEWTVCHGDFAGPGMLIQVSKDRSVLPAEWSELADSNPAGDAALHRHRIVSGCPWFGVDCNETNLPQELQRNEQAISFTKGCYLGQETVARIDALGHVNQLLVVVRSNGNDHPPPVGSELKSGEKTVGNLTSISTDADSGPWYGLAIIKRKLAATGGVLDSATGPVDVVRPASGAA